MLRISYDLNIHSCLSPCGDEDMTPANIVGMAAIKGLDVIALTDHNSCKNCPAVMKFAEKYGVTVIPGMELTTQEEVHVLCLFAGLSDAMRFDTYVYEHLMPFPNREDIFGRQLIYNEKDEISGKVEHLLINSTDISFDYVPEIVERFGGIMIPAHIEKSSNSLLHNLGFVPPDSRFRCVEVEDRAHAPKLREQNPYLKECRIICNSDAHYLDRIHEREEFLEIRSLKPSDILAALTGEEG